MLARPLIVSSLALILAACASERSGQPRVSGVATDSQRAALIDQIKALQGTWQGVDENGTKWIQTFVISSNGSAVREVMFPGEPHEMTNMYHMDGSALIMTHYCAAGNQPRLRAVADKAGVFDFRLESISNLSSADAEFMGDMTLVVEDKDHIRQEWHSLKKGAQAEQGPVFKLTRVQ